MIDPSPRIESNTMAFPVKLAIHNMLKGLLPCELMAYDIRTLTHSNHALPGIQKKNHRTALHIVYMENANTENPAKMAT